MASRVVFDVEDSKQVRLRISRKGVTKNLDLIRIVDGAPGHEFLQKGTHLVYVKQTHQLAALFSKQLRAGVSPRVLDWGSGKGHMSFLLAKAGFAVTSCDLASGANDSSFGQLTPIFAELQPVVPLHEEIALPFLDGSFDLVTSIGVLEHTMNDEASLREVFRVLRPGGVFFVAFLPRSWSWTQRVAQLRGNSYHDRLYGSKATKSLLSSAGFDIVDFSRTQLFPKNTAPINPILERADDLLCWYTPLGKFATNYTICAIRNAGPFSGT
jgi:SAM-dependent methyltransferase